MVSNGSRIRSPRNVARRLILGRVAALLFFGVLASSSTFAKSLFAAAPPPAAKKSPAKAPPPAVVAAPNPLETLAVAVELPLAPETVDSQKALEPFSLGGATTTARSIALVNLLGAELATRTASQQFVLRPASDELENRIWNLFFQDPAQEKDGTAIAEFAFRDGQFWFAWKPAAAEQPHANHLRNCALQVALGPATRQVALRTPCRTDPIALDMDDATTRSWPIPYAPSPGKVQIEFSLKKESFPKYRFLGKSTLSGADETTWIDFGIKKEGEGLRIKLECRMSPQRGLQFQATPYFQLTHDAKLVRMSSAALQKAENAVDGQLRTLESQKKALSAAGGGQKKADKDKKKDKKKAAANDPLEAMQARIDQQLKAARAAQTQIEELKALHDRLDGKGRIDIRVFVQTERHTVVLLTSQRAGR